MNWTDKFYKFLPLIFQNVAISLFGLYWHWLRFGGNYNSFEMGYKNREKYSSSEWKDFQHKSLQNLLTLSAEKVPYYSRVWTNEQKLAALKGDLSKIPLLEKDPIRANPFDFVRNDIKPLYKVTNHTSGSTGTPIATIWKPSEMREAYAVRETRSANWAGVSFKLPRATFSGRIVEPDPNSGGPYYRYNFAEKQIYFSAFHLRLDTAQFYIEALKDHNIQWMTGYAVSFYLLAKFVLEQNLKVPPLKAVITTSEKLTSEMRIVMEKAYGCRIYEEYGTTEHALFASECEFGRLHISPDVGIVEILRSDGSPCDPCEVGEIVTTCLVRKYQPMIRYRLGDLGSWDNKPCPCGREMPVIKEVVGRIEDVIIGPDGRQMVRFHGIFVDQPHIIEGQIIQEKIENIRVKIVPTNGFDINDEEDVINRVQQRLGKEVNVVVELVNEIPRTKSGKFKAVISLINPKHE